MAGFVTVAHVFQRAQNGRAVLLLTSTAIGRTKGKVFTGLLALSARGCTYMSYPALPPQNPTTTTFFAAVVSFPIPLPHPTARVKLSLLKQGKPKYTSKYYNSINIKYFLPKKHRRKTRCPYVLLSGMQLLRA